MSRPRLLPVMIAACALAAPLYAGGVADTLAALAQSAAAPPAPPPSRQPEMAGEPGYADLLMPSESTPGAAQGAPAGACSSAVLDMVAQERAALDTRARDLDNRAQTLEALERRASEQLDRLQAARTELARLLETRTSLSKADLQRLVGIYGAMKPKDAARLLNETETPILVDLVDAMEERRSAPILAEMDAAKVNELTRTLALRRTPEADRPPAPQPVRQPAPRTAARPATPVAAAAPVEASRPVPGPGM